MPGQSRIGAEEVAKSRPQFQPEETVGPKPLSPIPHAGSRWATRADSPKRAARPQQKEYVCDARSLTSSLPPEGWCW